MSQLHFRKDTEIEFEISNNFADNLFRLMHLHKISRHDLVDELNVNYNSFNRIMIGQQRVPISLLLKVCQKFDVTVDEIISRNSVNVLEL